MELAYSISVHGVIDRIVLIPGKDSLPIVTFLADIRNCEDTITLLDRRRAGRQGGRVRLVRRQSFATIARDTTLLERNGSGTRRGRNGANPCPRDSSGSWLWSGERSYGACRRASGPNRLMVSGCFSTFLSRK